MLLLLLFGCFGSTSRPGCETVEVAVDDDDDLGDLGFTVKDLVDTLSGVRTFPAEVEGEIQPAELGLARADAPAVFYDRTPTSERTPRVGFGNDTLMVHVSCDDAVAVPMELDLTTADGAVAIVAEVDAVPQVWGDTSEEVGFVTMEHALDPAVDVVPSRGEETEGALYVELEGPHVSRVALSWAVPGDRGGVFQYPPSAEAR